MDRLLVIDSITAELRRQTVAAHTRIGRSKPRGEVGPGLWEGLAAHVASLPEREYERLRRVGALRGHSLDATHPPTHLRRHGLAAGGRHGAGVRLDEKTGAAIAVEPAGARARVAREVIRDHAV